MAKNKPSSTGNTSRNPSDSGILSGDIDLNVIISVMEHERLPIFLNDRDGRVISCNRAFENLLEKPRDEIVGMAFNNIVSLEEGATVAEMQQNHVASRPAGVVTACGTRKLFRYYTTAICRDGAIDGVLGFVIEFGSTGIDDHDRLIERSALIQEIFRQSPIGIEVYDDKGRLIEINDSALAMFGIVDPPEIAGFSLFDFPGLDDSIKTELISGETALFEASLSFETVKNKKLYKTTRSGEITLSTSITPVSKPGSREISGYIVQVQDITAHRNDEKRLEYLSFHDSLTGLYNRAFYENELVRFRSSRFQRIGVIICDLDGLKLVNDNEGHEAGDRVIKAAAGVIESAFRKGDLVARIGGDEFAALIPGADLETLERTVARIGAAETAYNDNGFTPRLSLSIGYATRENETKSLDDVIREADAGMYEIKRAKPGHRASAG